MDADVMPLKLHKANAELQIQISRLLQESGQRWLEVVSRASNEIGAEIQTEIQGIQKAENWLGFATLPAESFWRQLQQRVGNTQDLSQVAIRNQAAFTDGLKEVVENWQKAVSDVIGGASSAQPIQDIFKHWSGVWPVSVMQDQNKAGKDA